MGYELDRLMKMYGVGSPSMPSYSGASKPTDFTDPNYATKLANYEADKAAYDKFQQDYQGRIANVSPYSMAQFQRTGSTPATPPEMLKNPIYTNNPEYYKSSVEQAYNTGLNQQFDVAGRDYWASKLAKGEVMPGGLQQAMLNAQKAGTNTTNTGTTGTTTNGTMTPGTTASQIGDLYQSVFGREADTPGLQYWLNSGLSLPEIEANLRASDEFNSRQNLSTDYYAQGGQVMPSRGGAPQVPGALNAVKQTRDPRNVDMRNPSRMPNMTTYKPPNMGGQQNYTGQQPVTTSEPAYPQEQLDFLNQIKSGFSNRPQQPLVGGNPLNPGPLVGANPLTPPTTGGDYPMMPPVTGGDYPAYPSTGGGYPLPNMQPMFGDGGLGTQMPTQQFVGGLGGRQITPYAVDYSPQQQNVAPAAYAAGGAVKMSRGGIRPDPVQEEGGLLTLADIYGLSNPTELPMIEAPVQLASARQPIASDAEGFPVGDPAAIVAAGRAAVSQAQANARAGVQVDPAVYDDPAAAREGPPASTPAPAAGARASRPSMEELLKRYGAGPSQYAEQIRAASEKSRAETEAFREMLKKQMTGENENAPSKAEMYFRLAAALAAPTKTGGVMENVGLAAKELGEYQKEVTAAKRLNKAKNLELMLKGQELSMKSAKEELDALRALGAEEGRDRRQLIGEAIKEYIRSGEPQSAAGKIAKDKGLVPGTPEYQAEVEKQAQMLVAKEQAQLEATTAQMNATTAQMQLRMRQQEAAEKKAAAQDRQLSPKEFDEKLNTEAAINRRDAVIRDLTEALGHNKMAFGGTFFEQSQMLGTGQVNPNDRRVNATRQLQQILGKTAVDQLKEKLGNGITDFEQKSMRALQGVDALSSNERRDIILRAINDIMTAKKKDEEKLKLIMSGKYKEKTPDTAKPEGEE